jgi:hypothetical protein
LPVELEVVDASVAQVHEKAARIVLPDDFPLVVEQPGRGERTSDAELEAADDLAIFEAQAELQTMFNAFFPGDLADVGGWRLVTRRVEAHDAVLGTRLLTVHLLEEHATALTTVSLLAVDELSDLCVDHRALVFVSSGCKIHGIATIAGNPFFSLVPAALKFCNVWLFNFIPKPPLRCSNLVAGVPSKDLIEFLRQLFD